MVNRKGTRCGAQGCRYSSDHWRAKKISKVVLRKRRSPRAPFLYLDYWWSSALTTGRNTVGQHVYPQRQYKEVDDLAVDSFWNSSQEPNAPERAEQNSYRRYNEQRPLANDPFTLQR